MAGLDKGHAASKRLLKELQAHEAEPNEALLRLGPLNDGDLNHWIAVMKGISGTAYEGGLWKLNVRIPSNYPHSPPDVKFVTPICHPNIHFQTGEICLDLLKDAWSPAYTISSVLSSVHQLLTSAEPDSPLNVDIAQLLRQGDQAGFEALIRYYTETKRWDGL